MDKRLEGYEDGRLEIGDVATAMRLQWIEMAYEYGNASDTLAIEAALQVIVGTC